VERQPRHQRPDFESRGGDGYEWGSSKDGYCDQNKPVSPRPTPDTMEDSDGKQYLVTTKGIEDPCSLQMVTLDLSKGRFFYWPVSAGGGPRAFLTCQLRRTLARFRSQFAPERALLRHVHVSQLGAIRPTSPLRSPLNPIATRSLRATTARRSGFSPPHQRLLPDDNYWLQPRHGAESRWQYVVSIPTSRRWWQSRRDPSLHGFTR
jgi:hypothetical protein